MLCLLNLVLFSETSLSENTNALLFEKSPEIHDEHQAF